MRPAVVPKLSWEQAFALCCYTRAISVSIGAEGRGNTLGPPVVSARSILSGHIHRRPLETPGRPPGGNTSTCKTFVCCHIMICGKPSDTAARSRVTPLSSFFPQTLPPGVTLLLLQPAMLLPLWRDPDPSLHTGDTFLSVHSCWPPCSASLSFFFCFCLFWGSTISSTVQV